MLSSLRISNYRSLRDLCVDRFGRVNLITGRNNAGKSSFLEAAWLYATEADPRCIRSIIASRDELTSTADPSLRRDMGPRGGSLSESDAANSIRFLFYGRPDLAHISDAISIGTQHQKDELTLRIQWLAPRSDDDESAVQGSLFPVETADLPEVPDAIPFLIIGLGNSQYRRVRVSHLFSTRRYQTEGRELSTNAQMIRPNGLSPWETAQMWDEVMLTALEEDVVHALSLITTSVSRVSIRVPRGSFGDPVPIIKVNGVEEPIPLRSMGDGMNRVFGLILALVNSRDSVLLIDEFENGLHYSVQYNIWKLLFSVARRLNVQVFASTHSWDCISAFQKAAVEDQQEDGFLVRLDVRGERVLATVFDERKLSVATREHIEVR
jgi:hypothetical protein